MGAAPAQELLSKEDLQVLQEKHPDFHVEQVDGMIHLLVRGFVLPEAYTPVTVDLLLRLPANFPLVAPDMFWTHPEVRRKNDGHPAASNTFQTFGDERKWQRWSRHFAQAWRPGSDNLRTFLGSIRRELQKGI